MKRTLSLLLLLILLVGCAHDPPRPPDPVVVTVKEEVKIDPLLLETCDNPSFMKGPLNQEEALKFVQGEAIKLILCGKKHRGLVEAVSEAFNVSPQQGPK